MEDFLEQTNLVMYDLNFIQKLIKTHANYEENQECCGLIGLNQFKEIQVIPCENTHVDKVRCFEISPKAFIEKSEGIDVVSIYHSHIISEARPSEYDKMSSENWCLPFYIYSVKTDNFFLHFPKSYSIPKLQDRTYIPDIQNCFRFVVDYYLSKDILPYFELNFALTKNGEQYSDKTVEVIKKFLRINKFKKIIDKQDIQIHDLLLFEVDGFFSHFGVFCEDDQFWHHEGGFISRKSHVNEEFIQRIHSIYRPISCI